MGMGSRPIGSCNTAFLRSLAPPFQSAFRFVFIHGAGIWVANTGLPTSSLRLVCKIPHRLRRQPGRNVKAFELIHGEPAAPYSVSICAAAGFFAEDLVGPTAGHGRIEVWLI